LLPNKSGLGHHCLDSARYGIAWGAIGAAMDCYDTALRYAKNEFNLTNQSQEQLQQKKLAEMITEITKAQLLTWRLGVLKMKEERQLLKSLWPKKQCRHGN
jgi:glutaryl-CoA dehydrogenase